MRARDHYTSSTLIGGKYGAGPSSLLHSTLAGPTEHVKCQMDVYVYMASNGSWFHGHLDYFFKNHLLKVGNLTQTAKPCHSKRPQPLIHSTLSRVSIRMNRNSLKQYSVEDPVTYDFTHYTWRSVTTRHDFGGELGRLGTLLFWAPTIAWSRPLARMSKLYSSVYL